jgi:hypothetical protein
VISKNIAAADKVYTETYKNIEVYNPNVPAELENSSLPRRRFRDRNGSSEREILLFGSRMAPQGFRRKPQQKRYITRLKTTTTPQRN